MKDTDRALRSLLAWDGTAALSVVLAIAAGQIAAALEAFVLRLGPLHARLFPRTDRKEIWKRVEGSGAFLILSVYCPVILAPRQRVEAERAPALLGEQEARRCWEQAVRVAEPPARGPRRRQSGRAAAGGSPSRPGPGRRRAQTWSHRVLIQVRGVGGQGQMRAKGTLRRAGHNAG